MLASRGCCVQKHVATNSNLYAASPDGSCLAREVVEQWKYTDSPSSIPAPGLHLCVAAPLDLLEGELPGHPQCKKLFEPAAKGQEHQRVRTGVAESLDACSSRTKEL